eukprot:TRINITY_DN15862_c0_g1_i1.p1 TRINITY_DN15862_c0_g1~~TRINITY_DN15862_c0_g1_i1.p1  ORF type:complete len:105 (+),score=18.50 TRINITY_DN15862_c0_g1_i1:543-857(+)
MMRQHWKTELRLEAMKGRLDVEKDEAIFLLNDLLLAGPDHAVVVTPNQLKGIVLATRHPEEECLVGCNNLHVVLQTLQNAARSAAWSSSFCDLLAPWRRKIWDR